VGDLGHDSFIDEIASELRRPVRLDPQFDARVMEAIEAPDVIPLRRSFPRPWILRPWTISVSPLAALSVAAAIAGFVLLGVWRGGAPAPSVADESRSSAPLVNVMNAPRAEEHAVQTHQFLIVAPDAKKMVVVGDFNYWDGSRTPMTRLNAAGLWSVTVPLVVGRHEFQYVQDDTLRLNDPTLPQSSSDFGSPNSVVTVALGRR
jgi:hypothetical protein